MTPDASSDLQRRLREADPASNTPEMEAGERRRMLARLRGAAAGKREAAAVPGGLRWAAIFGVATVLIASVLWYLAAQRPVSTWPGGSGPLQPSVALAPRVTDLAPGRSALRPRTLLRPSDTRALPARRTIHFTAPRGTRLVWQVPGDSNAG